FRMTVAAFLASPAERDIVQDRDIVANRRRLTDNKAGGVIEEDALADPGGRIDIRLEHAGGAALQIERQIAPAAIVEPMRQPMGLDRVKALEIEHRVEKTQAGRVTIIDGLNVDAQDTAPVLPVLDHL